MLVARYETRSSDRGAFVLMEQGLGSTKDSPSLAEKGRRRLVVVLAVPLELQLLLLLLSLLLLLQIAAFAPMKVAVAPTPARTRKKNGRKYQRVAT